MICKHIKAVPAGEQLITLCALNGETEGFESLVRFVASYEKITEGRVYTSRSDVSIIVNRYIELMDEIIQTKIVGYTDLQDFNIKNPYQKIPFRCLCISGLELQDIQNMGHEILRLLKQGYKAGIQMILQINAYDEKKTVEISSKSNELDEILELEYNYLEMDNNFWRNRKYPCIDMIIKCDTFHDNESDLYSEFDNNYKKNCNQVLQAEILNDSDSLQTGYSGDMLQVPIGINESGRKQYLEMGDPVANGTSHYAIIAGPTGSGKSTLLHTIIMEALMIYNPDELELYLMDFKEGTEFKIYEGKRLPQIKCIALDAMQEFGESILNYLWKILEERTELFREASVNGVEIKNISQYRNAGYRMPRILVIIDEFQVLFDRDQNKKVADRCAAKMSDFISRARVYGIHFVFATQTMHKIFEGTSSISRATLDEMHIRIGLQCQPKEMELLFGNSNLKEGMAKNQAQKGSAVYLENDIISKPIGFKVAYINPEKQKRLLEQMEEQFEAYEGKHTCLVFRGKSEPVLRKREIDNIIYLGEPISISEPVGIDVSKRRRNNLLIVGENQIMLDRILELWISQVMSIKRNVKEKSVFILDGAEMVDEKSNISGIIKTGTDIIKRVNNVFQVIPTIEQLYAIYSARKKRMTTGNIADEDKEKMFLVICNYQWIEPIIRLMENKSIAEFLPDEEESNALDDLLNSFKDDSSAKMSVDKKLHILLENGYLCGIHITMSCNDFSYMKRILMSDLAPFTNRIVLKTVSNVAHTLIDTDINMKYMKDNTVLYSDGITEPFVFKPYRLEE